MKRVLWDYWVEFAALLVVVAGILLVVLDFDLLKRIGSTLRQSWSALGGWEVRFYTWLQGYIARFGLGDLMGWLLVFFGLAFVVWRGRHHFYRSAYWRAVNCPRCGSELHRIHRTTWDRFLSRTLLLGARRYQCKNPDCGWSGLRERREADRAHKRRRHIEIE